MDAFMNKLGRLADLASRRTEPVPLDAQGVMARIRGLEMDTEAEIIPLRFLAGGTVAAAAAAAFALLVGASAWHEIFSPDLVPIDSLISLGANAGLFS